MIGINSSNRYAKLTNGNPLSGLMSMSTQMPLGLHELRFEGRRKQNVKNDIKRNMRKCRFGYYRKQFESDGLGMQGLLNVLAHPDWWLWWLWLWWWWWMSWG